MIRQTHLSLVFLVYILFIPEMEEFEIVELEVNLLELELRLLLFKRKLEEEKHSASTRKKRSVWVAPWLKKRDEYGACNQLLPSLRNGIPCERKLYSDFHRLPDEEFEFLLDLVTPYIQKQNTNVRKAITPATRLACTLHFLATGNSFRSLQFLNYVPQCTMTTMLPEVLDAIYTVLAPTYLVVRVYLFCILFAFMHISINLIN